MPTILSNRVCVLLDKYNLTVGGLEATLAAIKEAQDKTTINDLQAKNMMGAVGSCEFAYSGLFDNAATSNFLGLKALLGSDTERALSLHLGLAVADRAGLSLVKVLSLRSGARHGELLPVSGTFAPHLFPLWGHILYPLTTLTATTSGGSVDGGSQTTNGGEWAYHVIAFSATGGNVKWTLTLQDSADNLTWAAVAGEPTAINITATGAARRTFTGTLRRYVRLLITLDATSGSITLAGTLIRL